VRLADGRSAHAEIVVGADGRHSLVGRKVTPPVEHDAPPYRALYYRYFTGFLGPDGAKPDAAEFSQLDDELAYIFPSDSGFTCVAVSVNLETFSLAATGLPGAVRRADHPAPRSRPASGCRAGE
jgi:2-polyprenyl-6-methoxyphenol hydroxylase-like FAD-dependent oxidoreductase